MNANDHKHIKWGRSEDGYVDSKDGRWAIVPLWCGTTTPQYYALYDRGRDGKQWKKVADLCDTQRDCKEEAETIYVKEVSARAREVVKARHK